MDFNKEINQLHAQICSGLADPNRILILYALAEQPLAVNQIAKKLQLSQPTVSRHLKILRDKGLVISTRNRQSLIYKLADRRIIQALDLMRMVMVETLETHVELARSATDTFSS